MQFFHWNFQWDPVSSQTWVFPGGHRPFVIKIRSRWEALLSPELAAMRSSLEFSKMLDKYLCVFSPQAPAFLSVRAVRGCAKAVVVKAPSRFVVDVLVVGEIMRFS